MATPDPSGENSGRLALFFKGVRGLSQEQLHVYLSEAFRECPRDAYILAFQLRDCRGGKGERELGRQALAWLAKDKARFSTIVHYIPEYGRWDDCVALACNDTVPLVIQKELIDLLCRRLQKDHECMLRGEPCSLAAKWAPSANSAWDRKHKVVARMCAALSINADAYRRNLLTPLRAYLKIVERYMCAGNWGDIQYSKVPSCALKRLKKAFARHDKERWEAWKAALTTGTVKANAGQLFPHELVKEVLNDNYDADVTEAQWRVLVNNVKRCDSLSSCLAIVDVSGSMNTGKTVTPMHVALALGLMIAELASGSFHNRVITFHAQPELYTIQGTTLKDRIASLGNAPWGMNTNFLAVFQLLLTTAQMYQTPPECMPKTLYVLSDMQFDAAGGASTNYQTVRQMYATAGYPVPNIVFWNLNGASSDFPCTADDNGTVLISGFSTAILDSMLTKGRINPLTIMQSVINSARYAKIYNKI